jgi:hypothetical protein
MCFLLKVCEPHGIACLIIYLELGFIQQSTYLWEQLSCGLEQTNVSACSSLDAQAYQPIGRISVGIDHIRGI